MKPLLLTNTCFSTRRSHRVSRTRLHSRSLPKLCPTRLNQTASDSIFPVPSKLKDPATTIVCVTGAAGPRFSKSGVAGSIPAAPTRNASSGGFPPDVPSTTLPTAASVWVPWPCVWSANLRLRGSQNIVANKRRICDIMRITAAMQVA